MSVLLTLAGQDGPDVGSVGVTAVVQIIGYGAGVVGHGAVLGGQVTAAVVIKGQPAGLAGPAGYSFRTAAQVT